MNGKRLWDIVRATREARQKFSIDSPGCIENESVSLATCLCILTEELGKLCRSVNKLGIARDPSIHDQWIEEARHRFITSMSLLDRIGDRLDKSIL